jgi:hypothetical protein
MDIFAPVPSGKTRYLELRQKIKDAEDTVRRTPGKSGPLWELCRAELELYISCNLSQVRNIFWITLIVMVSGFGLASFGVFNAYGSAPISVSLLAAGSGIITQFIGATFLLIYRSTMAQASAYVEMLERIHTVGMAVQIVDLIPDDYPEKNKTRGDLVHQIVGTRSRRVKMEG